MSCPLTKRDWYRGVVLNVRKTDEGKLQYQIAYTHGHGQYTEWVSGELLGQGMQFWLDMKDNWIDPMKHQNVESSDQQINVSSTDNVVSTTRVDQTSDDED